MENTNQNVVSTYFNSNIENYASTLASTITQNGGIIYIQQSGNDIQYQSNSTSGTWTNITSFPVSFVNSNPITGNILTISLFTNITIGIATGYFICGSSYITYDGTGKTITISNVSNYLAKNYEFKSHLVHFFNVFLLYLLNLTKNFHICSI